MSSRILIATETDLVLIGVQTILKDRPEIEIVDTARTADELLAAAEGCKPDVILLSERLDALVNMLALVERLRRIAPDARLIVLGNLRDGLLVRDLLAAGVLAYLYSGDDLSHCLLPAIRLVMQDRPYLSPTASAEYLTAMQTAHANVRLDGEARQVLQLLAHGEHIDQISRQMGVEKRRIYWVREKLRRRFGAKTNEHLIQRAVTEGFVNPGE